MRQELETLILSRLEMGKSQKVSILANSYKYFVEHVLIILHDDCYRLLVIHKWQLLTDQCYKTLRGAKIAFSRLYNQKKWKKEVEPEWSDFYVPGVEYFDNKTNTIEK